MLASPGLHYDKSKQDRYYQARKKEVSLHVNYMANLVILLCMCICACMNIHLLEYQLAQTKDDVSLWRIMRTHGNDTHVTE